jgi:hypothetical protein
MPDTPPTAPPPLTPARPAPIINVLRSVRADGFFIVLAVVMYVTRKVDWYARDSG